MRREVPAVQAEYIDVTRARALPGLRLVLTSGVPGPWGEAAKGIFHAKKIPFARVRQEGGGPNEALFQWTGHRNAPVAVYQDEPARTGWAEILFLAERLAPEPALIPADEAERAQMFGLAHELMGEDGFGWNRRHSLFSGFLGGAEQPPPALQDVMGRLVRQYRYSKSAAEAANARVAAILRLFSERLRTQRAKGHEYLMGKSVSALDIYWAAMAAMVEPLPAAQCPMPEGLRSVYVIEDPALRSACSPELLAHRDRIYAEHLELPVAL
jgi:glutathione S-transferase